MNKIENVKLFAELYELLNFYYEHRDQPVESGFDFFKRVEALCDKLNLDYEVFKSEFKLTDLSS